MARYFCGKLCKPLDTYPTAWEACAAMAIVDIRVVCPRVSSGSKARREPYLTQAKLLARLRELDATTIVGTENECYVSTLVDLVAACMGGFGPGGADGDDPSGDVIPVVGVWDRRLVVEAPIVKKDQGLLRYRSRA